MSLVLLTRPANFVTFRQHRMLEPHSGGLSYFLLDALFSPLEIKEGG